MAGSSGTHPVVLTPADIPGAIPFPRRGKTFSQVKLRLLARVSTRKVSAGSSGTHPVVLTPADIPGAIPFLGEAKRFPRLS